MSLETTSKSTWSGLRNLLQLLTGEWPSLVLVFLTVLASSGLNALVPWAFGRAIDTVVLQGDMAGIWTYAAALLGGFAVMFVLQYGQMRLMGRVGLRVLFRLRQDVFAKLQHLPLATIQAQQSGDLISRINADTEKMSQFFSETVVRFLGGVFMMIASVAAMLLLDIRLGTVALVPAIVLLVITQLTASRVKQRTKKGLQTLGTFSAQVQDSLGSFKALVAFDRRDYLVKRVGEANQSNFRAAWISGVANGMYMPIYDLLANSATIAVLGFGAWWIAAGSMTVGLLVGFLLYVERLYMPLRQIGTLWGSVQSAIAGWDRISELLRKVEQKQSVDTGTIANVTYPVLAFECVNYGYTPESLVLQDVSFALESGKTYAFVGPTGGGKTTTASLMARLFDPVSGVVRFQGRDIRSLEDEERTQQIGFILQDPFLFSGSLLDNIFYGHPTLATATVEVQSKELEAFGFMDLLKRFPQGLDQVVSGQAESLSLGQRQLIAFMRAVLRKPALLILDEATANVDTVTEKQLQVILDRLPSSTTRVVIAHRLNTIANADGIFFVGQGAITSAGSLEQAVEMLMGKK